MNPSTAKSCDIYFSLGKNASADWVVQVASTKTKLIGCPIDNFSCPGQLDNCYFRTLNIIYEVLDVFESLVTNV